ncbi:hypothetical protein ATANTOWER_009186 [Ataeniobius toweri]|uniref:Uncharacterized protein n=1 Tax=Ataeniobius toweri TaxID=208326 RepID=A0ABU7C9L7_9TELE|nr:hypothetical protein [Ataeniobius toweri]
MEDQNMEFCFQRLHLIIFTSKHSATLSVCVSDRMAPRGTGLATFLLALYTADFSINSSGCHLEDDFAVVGLITGEDH